jgi:hypothetical protein
MHLGVKKKKSKILPWYLNSSQRHSSFNYFRFFDHAHFLQLRTDNFCTVHSPNDKKVRSVEFLNCLLGFLR